MKSMKAPLISLLVTLPLTAFGARQYRRKASSGDGDTSNPLSGYYKKIPSASPIEPVPVPSKPIIEHTRLVEKLYDVPLSDASTLRDAMENCDTDLGCAAISLQAGDDDDDDDDDDGTVTYLYRHTFLDGSNYSDGDNLDSFYGDGPLSCSFEEEEQGSCPSTSIIDSNAKLVGNSTHLTAYTSKPYAFHRGKIIAGRVLGRQQHITIEQAKKYCTTKLAPDCIAFTFPVWSATELNTVKNFIFFSTVSGFEKAAVRGGKNEWRTYISTDPQKSNHVKGDALNDIGMEKDDWEEWGEAEKARLYKTCCNEDTTGGFPSAKTVAKADTMKRIICNLTRQEFYEQYEVPRKPVMLTGCADRWPARKKWTYEKLAPRFSNDTVWRSRLGESHEDYYMHRWDEITYAMRNNEKFYVFDQLVDSEEAKSLEDDYEIPDPIKGANLYAEMNSRDFFFNGPLRWFCVGKFGSGTQPHNDPYASDAWNTLIKGHKWWIIWPEEVDEDDHLDYIKCDQSCSNSDPLVKEWASAIGINAARTEYVPGKYAQHILQRPGETIYVPDGRLHTVFNLDETIAITANYGTAANLDEVWKAACQDGHSESYEMAKIMYNLVLNTEQRKQVRQSKYWPMESACNGPQRRRHMIEDTPALSLVDALYDTDWFPAKGDIAEVRYRGNINEYYHGTVTRASHGTYDIRYPDGDDDWNLPRKALHRFESFTSGELVDVMDEDIDEWRLAVIKEERGRAVYEVLIQGQSRLQTVHEDSIRRFDWSYRPGNRVLAFYEEEDEWFPGTVRQKYANQNYGVEFDDGDWQNVDKYEIVFIWASKALDLHIESLHVPR